MASILKLPDIWRVIREVDLEAIRRDAEARFRLLVLGDDGADAQAAAALLSGTSAPHPWIEVLTPAQLELEGDDGATITVAIVLADAADTSPATCSAIARLARASVPVVTVVHGTDRAADKVARRAETARVAVAAIDAGALEPIGEALAQATPPTARLALARQLPPLRDAIFDLLIEDTAKANATYAFTAAMAEQVPVLDVPLNIADMLILTKNQLLMGYKIALGAGKSGRARDLVGEVIGVVGFGFLFRQAARGLVGLIPVAGLVPKVAIAYTGTWAIGRGVVVWATEGRRLSPSSLGRFSKDAAGRGRALAKGLLATRKQKRRLLPGGGPAA